MQLLPFIKVIVENDVHLPGYKREIDVENSETLMQLRGAKGDWDFQISGLVKNPDGTDIWPLW